MYASKRQQPTVCRSPFLGLGTEPWHRLLAFFSIANLDEVSTKEWGTWVTLTWYCISCISCSSLIGWFSSDQALGPSGLDNCVTDRCFRKWARVHEETRGKWAGRRYFIPLHTLVYPCTPLYTTVYPCTPLLTFIYSWIPLYTPAYPCIPLFTPFTPVFDKIRWEKLYSITLVYKTMYSTMAGFQLGRELSIKIKNILNIPTTMTKTIHDLNILP